MQKKIDFFKILKCTSTLSVPSLVRLSCDVVDIPIPNNEDSLV